MHLYCMWVHILCLCCVGSQGRRSFSENVLGLQGWNLLCWEEHTSNKTPNEKNAESSLQQTRTQLNQVYQCSRVIQSTLKDMVFVGICMCTCRQRQKTYRKKRLVETTEGGCVGAIRQFQLLIMWHVSTCFTCAASHIISPSPASCMVCKTRLTNIALF